MGGRRRGEGGGNGSGSGKGREGKATIPRKKESHSCGPSATVNAGVDIELDCTDFDSISFDHRRGQSTPVAFLFPGDVSCEFALLVCLYI